MVFALFSGWRMAARNPALHPLSRNRRASFALLQEKLLKEGGISAEAVERAEVATPGARRILH